MNALTDKELLKHVASMAESEVFSNKLSGEENIRLALAMQKLAKGNVRESTGRVMTEAADLVLTPSADEVDIPETQRVQLTTAQQMLQTEMKYHQTVATKAYGSLILSAAPTHTRTLTGHLQAAVNAAHHVATGQVVPAIAGLAPQLVVVTSQHYTNAMHAARPHMLQLASIPGPEPRLPIAEELAAREVRVVFGGLQRVFEHMLSSAHPGYDSQMCGRIASHATYRVFMSDEHDDPKSHEFASSFSTVARSDVHAAHLGSLLYAVQQALAGNNYDLSMLQSGASNNITPYSLRPQFTGGSVQHHDEDEEQQRGVSPFVPFGGSR